MPLSEAQRAKAAELAQATGRDPAELIAKAEAAQAGQAEPGADAPRTDGKPIFERLLIGVLPFITVNELREHWLKLPPAHTDGEMFCGEFAIKHGGPASGGGETPPAAE